MDSLNLPEMAPPQYNPAPRFSLSGGDTAFAIGAIVMSIFTAIFGIFGGFALGFLLSHTLMLILFTLYFAKSAKLSFFGIVSGLLSLGSGVVFITTTNGSVRFFAFVMAFLLALCYLCGLTQGKQRGNRQTVGIFYSAASTIGNIGISLKSLFASRGGNKKTFGKVLLGLVCALPILIIVIALLISSDDAFQGLMSSIFEGTFTTFLKANIGLALSLFVIAYGFSLKFGKTAQISKAKSKGIENVYLISFLSSFAVCYLLYLFSQLAYFFSAFKGFLPNGEITHAQYARKGFFEMCAIAVINLLIVFISLLIAKKRKGKACPAVKALATFIALFTLIIIATAISKMVLYIGEYGMTVKRLTTSSFMLFLAIVFIAVAFKIYVRKINIIKTALLTAGIVVLLLGIFNVNTVCAKYNYEAYVSNKLDTIDVAAIYNLGDEGVPYLIKLACHKDVDVAEQAQRKLTNIYLHDYFGYIQPNKHFTADDLKQSRKYNGFKRFSLPKEKAYNELYKFVENNPTFTDTCWYFVEDTSDEFFW